MPMIRYFAAHPTAANLLLILIVAAGVLAAPTLKRETFPRYEPSEVGIDVAYPGAAAADVEDAVCARLEDAIEGVTDLGELRCEALDNRASLVAEMREGGRFPRFLDEVKTEVDAVDDLPERAETPLVRQLHRTEFVASMALAGDMAVPDLKAYAEILKDRLQGVAGVSLVNLRGFSDHQLRIEVPNPVLRQHGLSVEQLAQIVGRQNVDLPAGSLETADQEVRLRFRDERRSPRELEELVVVAGDSGGEVRLGDIATVTDLFEDPEQKITFNGRRAAVLEVHKTVDEDSLGVVDALRGFIERERRRAPPGVELALAQDVSSIARDRLTMLVVNGIQGLLLVFLAMWLFFGLRFSFWVALGLPVSFLGTMFFMAITGYSMNMITMVGLLMAIGLLMDDAIVISENIAAHLNEGRSPLDAVVTGTSQVAPGVLSSFVTTACVFTPLAFLSGDIGTVLEVMPVVLLITLAVSLVEAFLILPHHLVHPVRRMAEREPGRFRRRFESAFETLRERGVGTAADLAVRYRYLFAGVMAFALIATGGYIAGGNLKFQAFPDIDGDVVEARLLMPQGTPLHHTEAVIARITDALARVNDELTPRQPREQPLVEDVQVRFAENRDAHETGPHVATVVVDLLGAEVRTITLDVLYARWRAEIGRIPGAIQLTMQEPSIGPQGLPFEFRLQGDDLQALKAASVTLQEALSAYAGPRDVMDDLRPGKPERHIRLAEGATSLGLDAATVAGQLRAAFLGETAAETQVGPESYEIQVRQPSADRDSLQDLDDFTITLPDGGQAPLSAVATVEPARGWARIHRIDGRRTVTVTGELDTRRGNAMQIIDALRRETLTELRQQYPGVTINLEGQAKEAATTGGSVQSAFLFGLVGIFVILAFQFRSYLEPLVVMTAIPFAGLGAVWGHVLLGYPISMPSLVGAASLAGVVVNDSILLVQFVKLRSATQRSAADAARLASRDRFRAVLLTSLTTILGLLPLLAEGSLQAQVLKPLVISVVFGLFATTLVVLFLVPALYSVIDDARGAATLSSNTP
ncbi:efflux RND transporter permease subunit [Arhodomonas sp. AD133]|uniref:efflux RND transporter permease subunit n=1 Tax=Arhodomonas sp. AD133 TaxID=3415009 RepID=UPI003EBF90B0